MKKINRYSKIFQYLLKDPSLMNPNLIIKDVKSIDYKKLREIGIKYVVFDKDNTLTETYKMNYYNDTIKQSIIDCK
jgi:phosphatidylglycerophosphatase GEP4